MMLLPDLLPPGMKFQFKRKLEKGGFSFATTNRVLS